MKVILLIVNPITASHESHDNDDNEEEINISSFFLYFNLYCITTLIIILLTIRKVFFIEFCCFLFLVTFLDFNYFFKHLGVEIFN